MENNEALDKAKEMLLIPMKDLPAEAKAYLKYLTGRVGMCIEVCLTAYAHYYQAVHKLPCEDPLYKIDAGTLQWFKENNFTNPQA